MNKRNLEMLACAIEGVCHDLLIMTDYMIDLDGDTPNYEDAHACGIAGCLIGWGAVALPELSCDYRSYFEFSSKCFGLTYSSIEWEWCFSADWMGVDSSPTGGSLRIQYLIDNNEPPEWFNSSFEFDKSKYFDLFNGAL